MMPEAGVLIGPNRRRAVALTGETSTRLVDNLLRLGWTLDETGEITEAGWISSDEVRS